jgi:hypothetical protein
MWPLAECLVGLIGLVALDDVIEHRSVRHTWVTSFALIGGVGLLLVAAIGIGRLIA